MKASNSFSENKADGEVATGLSEQGKIRKKKERKEKGEEGEKNERRREGQGGRQAGWKGGRWASWQEGKTRRRRREREGEKDRVEFSIIEGHKSSDGKFLPSIQHNF